MTRLALRQPPPFRLSLLGLIPERLAGLSDAEIARLPLQQGNRRGVVGDCFTVSGDGAGERLVIAGGGERLDDVGAFMSRGEILVEGDVGARAGLAMSGGRLIVQGAAGAGAATAMSGGELRIGGDAGEGLGGALPGERSGMSGGLVAVAGSAASGAGDRLRRGLIAIAGAVGPGCGTRMHAGTIVVGGRLDALAGAAMRRGSILGLGGCAELLPGFAESGIHDLVFQRLLARLLERSGLAELAQRLRPLRRWQGDLAIDGKGEILTAP